MASKIIFQIPTANAEILKKKVLSFDFKSDDPLLTTHVGLSTPEWTRMSFTSDKDEDFESLKSFFSGDTQVLYPLEIDQDSDGIVVTLDSHKMFTLYRYPEATEKQNRLIEDILYAYGYQFEFVSTMGFFCTKIVE